MGGGCVCVGGGGGSCRVSRERGKLGVHKRTQCTGGNIQRSSAPNHVHSHGRGPAMSTSFQS